MAETVTVEVACALPDRQILVAIDVPAGTRVRDVVRQSKIADAFPEVDVDACPLGIFGLAVDDDYVPATGDRVEIYRPLTIDPKEARRQRAKRGQTPLGSDPNK